MNNKPNQSTPGSASSSAVPTPAKSTSPAADTSSSSFDASASKTAQSSAGDTQPGRNLTQVAADTNASADTAATALLTEASNQFDKARKSWLNQDELLKGVNQLPQSLKDLGSKAAEQFNSLSTRQKVVGGALLVSGLSWLALRSKKSASSDVYTPKFGKGDSKWKASDESVYRGAAGGLHNSDTVYGTENGF